MKKIVTANRISTMPIFGKKSPLTRRIEQLEDISNMLDELPIPGKSKKHVKKIQGEIKDITQKAKRQNK